LLQDHRDSAATNLLGIMEIQRAHTDLAKKYFESALSYDPNLAQAYMNLGNIGSGCGPNPAGHRLFPKVSAKGRIEEASQNHRQSEEGPRRVARKIVMYRMKIKPPPKPQAILVAGGGDPGLVSQDKKGDVEPQAGSHAERREVWVLDRVAKSPRF